MPLADTLVNDLQELYNQMKKYKNFKNNWFVFGDENPISIYKMNYQNEKNAKLAEVKVINLHCFRHSCASLLINTGQPVTTVSKYLGHASTKETLDTYAHMFPNNLTDVKNTMDNLNLSI